MVALQGVGMWTDPSDGEISLKVFYQINRLSVRFVDDD